MNHLITLCFLLTSLFTASAYAQKDELDIMLDELQAGLSESPEIDAAVDEVRMERSRMLDTAPKKRSAFRARKYSDLNKENPEPRFDKEGFHKERQKHLGRITEQEKKQDSYSGGYICLGENPQFLGKIFGSPKNTGMFEDEDELEIELTVPGCKVGQRYMAVNKDQSGVYKIAGVVQVVDQALKPNRCIAYVKEVYDLMQRGVHLVDPVTLESSESEAGDQMKVGKVYKFHSQRTMAATGDRLCVVFKDTTAPKAGTVVYFYGIKDPVTGHEVDPYLVAKGKLIHSASNYGTALVVSTNMPVTKHDTVTTRF